jgi:hypothetical protein
METKNYMNGGGSRKLSNPIVIDIPDEETERYMGTQQAGYLAEASTEFVCIVEKYTQIYGSETVFKLKGLSILGGLHQTQSLLLSQWPPMRWLFTGTRRFMAILPWRHNTQPIALLRLSRRMMVQ